MLTAGVGGAHTVYGVTFVFKVRTKSYNAIAINNERCLGEEPHPKGASERPKQWRKCENGK